MEKESHEENNNNNTISGDFMAKRNRGRPRKQMKLDSNKQPLDPSPGSCQKDDDEALVGQLVSGVIEATFEAGFLLSVKVGNSDNMLRGVVFKPGRCDPISVDNDVAPDVPMIRRNKKVMHHHDGSSKEGRKSREKRGGNGKNRGLVPVPIQPALPNNHFVPVVFQPVNLQNGDGQVPVHPIHHGPMQTETRSQVSNDKPFEMLLTEVMKKGESEEQALSIEPLQTIHPVHPVTVSNYGQGKMTELLQAVQENVRETHFSQGQ